MSLCNALMDATRGVPNGSRLDSGRDVEGDEKPAGYQEKCS